MWSRWVVIGIGWLQCGHRLATGLSKGVEGWSHGCYSLVKRVVTSGGHRVVTVMPGVVVACCSKVGQGVASGFQDVVKGCVRVFTVCARSQGGCSMVIGRGRKFATWCSQGCSVVRGCSGGGQEGPGGGQVPWAYDVWIFTHGSALHSARTVTASGGQ